jgi:hypothetical protein
MKNGTDRTHGRQAGPPATSPEWQVSEWLNIDKPLRLASLRGKVVLMHAFQMLCPGCVSHGLPQAERVRQLFSDRDVCVVGLHTVFEHHDVMNAQALRAFVHEYRWSFPIGIDRPAPGGGVPVTMQAYGLRGTPSHVLLDRQGLVRAIHFGRMDDLELGSMIGKLLAKTAHEGTAAGMADPCSALAVADGCSDHSCAAPHEPGAPPPSTK